MADPVRQGVDSHPIKDLDVTTYLVRNSVPLMEESGSPGSWFFKCFPFGEQLFFFPFFQQRRDFWDFLELLKWGKQDCPVPGCLA